MVEFPDHVYNNVFDGEIKKGTIVKTNLLCHDGIERPHYFITLSPDTNNDPLVFVISTTQLKFYNDHPFFNKEIVRIPVGQVECLTLESIIDCRKLTKIARNKLQESYRQGLLIFCGIMPAEIMAQIETIVKESRFIPNNDKKLILGDNFQ